MRPPPGLKSRRLRTGVSMSRCVPLLTVLTVVVLSGIVHGLWTDRWVPGEEPERAAARLADVPLTLGDWDGRAGQLDARHVEVAELSGYLLREYVHRRTGNVVSVLLVCGRPGPV